MAEHEHGVACTHACTWGCGRKYDIIITQVVDASTLMLCMPCLISFARNLAEAMIEPDSAAVQEVIAAADLSNVMLVTDPETPNVVRGFSNPAAADDEFTFDGM